MRKFNGTSPLTLPLPFDRKLPDSMLVRADWLLNYCASAQAAPITGSALEVYPESKNPNFEKRDFPLKSSHHSWRELSVYLRETHSAFL
jgi:hypothetical protein